MKRTDIADRLKTVVESQTGSVINSYDEALDIDSFTMMLVITYVKETMGVKLDVSRLDFDSFKSLHVFTDIVLKHMEEQRDAS